MNYPRFKVYEFDKFRLDSGRRLLFRADEQIALPPKAFDLLLVLIESDRKVIEKNELMRRIWQDSFVEDNNLTVNMTHVRKALGEKRGENRFIATIPGRGYQFIAEVREPADDILIIEEISTTDVFIEEKFIETETPTSFQPLLPAVPEHRKSSNFISTGSLFAGVLAVLLGLSFLVYAIFFPHRIESVSQVRTIAVLPFKPLAASEQDALLGLGMADTLIAKLSSIKKIMVRPTSAIAKYAAPNQNLSEAGRDLNVDALLDGKIQRNGDNLRVSVQLLRVSDNATIWANTFEARELDIFSIQDSISAQVAESLSFQLNSDERQKLAKHSTENAEAYKLYLNGLFQLNKRTLETTKRAILYFEEATEKQPDYALAYAGLGDAYMLLGNQEALLGGLPQRETMPKAKSALIKALNLDNELPAAFATRAWITLWDSGDFNLAKQDLRRANELNPNLPTTHHYTGLCLMTEGKFGEALTAMKKAQDLDQFSLIVNLNVGTVLFRAKNYSEAEIQARKTLELNENFARGHWLLGLIQEQQGKFADAIISFQRAVELSGGGTLAKSSLAHALAKSGKRAEAEKILTALLKNKNEVYVPSDSVAIIYTALGEKDKAFEYLQKAVEERPFSMFQLGIEQRFDELRGDSRFSKIKNLMDSKANFDKSEPPALAGG